MIQKRKKEFSEVLTNVATMLDKITTELVKFNKEGYLKTEKSDVKPERRFKRDVSNETVGNATSSEKNATENVTTTENPETVVAQVEPLPAKVKNETLKAKTRTIEDIIKNNDTTVTGRRMMPMHMGPVPEYVTTTSRVKDKLLSYLEDTFNEVERKIKPLTNIKIALSNDDHYRIGYIIATIDTLEVNLKKLKNDMNLHQHDWDDEKILDLFDRIKATNTVTTTLIESLKKYLPRS